MKLKISRRNPLYLILVLIGAIILLFFRSQRAGNDFLSPAPILTPTFSSNEFKVVKVIDGDTIELENGQKIRYIGMDAPESTIQNECFGKEAFSKNKELVEGKVVRLEKDVSETDRYGRLLRYVYLGDVFVNEYLVREGYASSATFPPDVKYQDKFREAEVKAREEHKGLWNACPLDVQTRGVSSAFQDKDCKDFKTQKEAQEFFLAEGGPSRDPHKLDSDGDGRVCVSLP